MKRKNISKWFKIITPILLVLGLLFTHFYAPRVITEIRNPLVELIRVNYFSAKSPTLKDNPLEGKRIEYKSFDKTVLVAYETYSKTDTVLASIILLHGIRAHKEHFMKFSVKLANEGFNTIALDSRAHGESGGQHCTFGVNEKRDVSSLIDEILKENPNRKIGIFGQSLGGAVALQSLGLDKRIQFGVVESTFSDFRTITNDYLKYHLGFNFKSLSNYFVNRAGAIANFDPDDASPVEYCKQITQPVLMVHGAEDKRIDIKYGRSNFANLKNAESAFLEIETANHLNVWKEGGEEYFKKVVGFMQRY